MIKKDFSIFYSGPKESTGHYGTGFVIKAKMRKCFLSFEPLNERTCKLRLRGTFRNITLISTYTPTEDSHGATEDEFCDRLSQEFEKVRSYDTLVLLVQKSAEKNVIETVAGNTLYTN